MNFLNNLPSIPKIRPQFNLGCLFDIPTGVYHLGKYGESILNGGMAGIVSVAGPGNSFKTVISCYMNMIVAERIKSFQCSIYDSEGSLSYDRIKILTHKFPLLNSIDHGSELLESHQVKFLITSSAEMLGDVYFDHIKDVAKVKEKESIKSHLTTPFLNPKGEIISILPPTGITLDSLSELKVTAQEEKIVNKNSIGDSGNNILYMRQGIAKKQLITQLPNISSKCGLYFTMVAHVGDEFELDAYAPKKHKLTHSKKGSKIIGTTKAFEFINNVLYEIFSVSLLNNKERNTGVLYPILQNDREADCTDLLLVTMKITRNKSGLSGASLPLVISQREGVLPHLTQFHYIKENNRYGLEGNNVTYSLSLLPEIKLNRTTVREKIDNVPFLRRALEITADMLQIDILWAGLEDDLMCSPETLYKDIKALGYDWSILLNTRSYWILGSEDDLLPFLSTMDLLRMRRKKYHPYWYPKDKLKKM